MRVTSVPFQTSPRGPFAGRRAGMPVLAIALLGLSPGAAALTDEEIYRSFRFRAAAPSARELARGGASIGLADEASAAWSNPAGLGWAARPMALITLGTRDADDLAFADAGTFDLSGTETYAAGTMLFDEERQWSPSFLAYVHPLNDYLVVAASRHEVMNVERDGLTTFLSGAFPPLEGAASGVLRQAAATESSMDLLLDTTSVSFASAIVDQFSLGLTVSIARLDVVSSVTNLTSAVADTDGDLLFDTFLTPVDYRTASDDSDTAFTFTAGLLYRPHRKIGIGLAYRDGPEFEIAASLLDDGVRAKELREYLALPRADGSVVADALGNHVNFVTFPDSYGLGVAFGPFIESRGGGGLRVAADVLRVEYTDLLDGFIGGLNNQLFGPDSTGVTYAVEDGTEYHLGVEYQWTVGYNNSVRAILGGYTESDHALLGGGRGTTVANPAGGFVTKGRFVATGDDEFHLTLGAGFTIKRGFFSFGLDAAADVSDLGTDLATAATFKF